MTTPAAMAADGTTSALLAALEATWAAIRARHPEVPAAVLVVAPGGDGRRLAWGHFAAGRWQHAGAARPEVLVVGEGLRRPARQVLGTLLHEAAHGLADQRGVRDTSRGGRYHNRRYKALAEELGLAVAQAGPVGWSATSVPDPTAAAYAGVLGELAGRLVLWRHRESRAGHAGGSRNLLACACGCPRRIRVAPATLDLAPILCAACGQPFVACPVVAYVSKEPAAVADQLPRLPTAASLARLGPGGLLAALGDLAPGQPPAPDPVQGRLLEGEVAG